MLLMINDIFFCSEHSGTALLDIITQRVREMGEVFCSHYVQVSQRVREMGEVFCSHYVQVSLGL